MGRKKKQPAQTVVNISLTEIDLVAKGTELANRMKQISSLRAQAAAEASRFRTLIDEQIELADTIASQIIGGTEARNQASLKANEAGELEVPEKPFGDECAHCDNPSKGQRFCSAACDRCDDKSEKGVTGDPEAPTAEEVAKHLGIKTVTEASDVNTLPPTVADAIARSGGEVDLSAGKAANGESLSDLADAATRKSKSRGGKKQPAAATPKAETVIVASAPSSCPECGGKVEKIDDSGVFACVDQHTLGCRWTAVVETPETTRALGPLSQQQASA